MINSVKFTNVTNQRQKIVGTSLSIFPGQTVDLILFLSLDQIAGIYGLSDMIDSQIVNVVVLDDSSATNVNDGLTFRNLILASISEEGGGGGPPPTPLAENIKYVDLSGHDTSGDGSFQKPYRTIGKACSSIGNATSPDQFNDADSDTWMIIIGTGTYVENITIPLRRVIQLGIEGVTIQGSITQFVDPAKVYGGMQNDSHLIIKGLDLADVGQQTPLSQITGDIRVNSGGSMLCHVELLNSIAIGNVTFVGQGSQFQGYLKVTDSDVGGVVSANNCAVSLYAVNSDDAPPNTIGGVTGNVALSSLKNVTFVGPVVCISNQGGKWSEANFSSPGNDFSGASGVVVCDSESADSFNANVALQGGISLKLVDNAEVIFFSPSTPSNWTPPPLTTREGLDQLAQRVARLEKLI